MHYQKTRLLVLTGLMLAVAIVLSVVENMLPPLPIPVPGVKFGLSNIAVMYALFFLGKKQAFTIALLKSVFVFATRGMIASLLSLAGGILSLVVMITLLAIFGKRISYLMISLFGAVAHNLGQFLVITLLYTDLAILGYLPLLMVSGILAGIATATLLKFILPAFRSFT